MSRYRLIQTNLNREYRNDLNHNFGQISDDIDNAKSDIKRVETETKSTIDNIVGGGFLEGLNIARDNANTAAVNANQKAGYANTQGNHAKTQGDYAKVQGDYAKLKGDYADDKAILADVASTNANAEASNLDSMKVAVVDATADANNAVTYIDGKKPLIDKAIADSGIAKVTSETVQSEFDQVVAEAGSNNPEVVQARGGEVNLNARLNNVTTQLADTAKQTGLDFVQLIRNHNEVSPHIYAKKLKDRSIEVAIPYKDDMSAYYSMEKDYNDDYIKLKEGSIRSVKVSENIYMDKSYDSMSGSILGSGANYYFRVTNSTLSFEFNGTGFIFNHYADNRGGLWEFNIDDGALVKKVSVYNTTSGNFKTKVVEGLADGSHNVVATFLGEDPENSPTDAARGWYKASSEPTFSILKPTLNGQKKFDILNLNSNIEYAISIRPVYPGYWLPEHGGVGTVFAESQEVYFDNELITDWTPDVEMKEVKSVRVIQNMKGFHPDVVGAICDIVTVHTFNSGGVSIQGKINFLQESRVTVGYVMMFPVYPSFAQQLITNNGRTYATTKNDGSETEVVGEPTSFAFVNQTATDNRENIVAAMTIDNPHDTFRVGKSGRRNPLIFIQHRDNTLQKLYPTILNNDVTVLEGDTFSFGGTIHIGEVPLASKLLS